MRGVSTIPLRRKSVANIASIKQCTVVEAHVLAQGTGPFERVTRLGAVRRKARNWDSSAALNLVKPLINHIAEAERVRVSLVGAIKADRRNSGQKHDLVTAGHREFREIFKCDGRGMRPVYI